METSHSRVTGANTLTSSLPQMTQERFCSLQNRLARKIVLSCYHRPGFFYFPGEDRKTPSESNSPSSSSLSALSDSANSKDDSDSSQKNKGGNNLLVISVVPGGQSSLNSEEKPEKGKGGAGLAYVTVAILGG